MTNPRNLITYYAEPLPGGRAILCRDVVIDGDLVTELSGKVGSPAPAETVRAHELTLILTDVGPCEVER